MANQLTKPRHVERIPAFPYPTLADETKAVCTRCGGTGRVPVAFRGREVALCIRCADDFAEIVNAWIMRSGAPLAVFNGEPSPEELAAQLEGERKPAPTLLF